MKYVLLNRSNLVVDILDGDIRYIKLQSSNGISVACEENEGTGVIGSDCNTHYVLIKSDMNSDPNAVRVMKFEEIPSDIRPNLAYFDEETGNLVSDLERAKLMKQEENKKLFAEYLDTHPLTWIDGKQYGITLEDQSEISLNINQYQMALEAGIENPRLEWHARKEGNVPWSIDDLVSLSLAIKKVIYPMHHQMSQYKTAIFNSKSIAELENIKLIYSDENEE